jgi:hypothetical protein
MEVAKEVAMAVVVVEMGVAVMVAAVMVAVAVMVAAVMVAVAVKAVETGLFRTSGASLEADLVQALVGRKSEQGYGS